LSSPTFQACADLDRQAKLGAEGFVSPTAREHGATHVVRDLAELERAA
jgi:hypothetical protein